MMLLLTCLLGCIMDSISVLGDQSDSSLGFAVLLFDPFFILLTVLEKK